MPEDIDEEVEDDQAVNAGVLRRALEAEKAKGAQLEADNRALAREVAFDRAALPDTPMAKFFRDHYAGEANPDAVKAAATAAGIIESNSVETRVEETMQAAVIGATNPPAAGTDDQVIEEMRALDSRDPFIADRIDDVLRRYGHHTATDER